MKPGLLDFERTTYNHYSTTQMLRFLGLVEDGKEVDKLIEQGELEPHGWGVTGESLRKYIHKRLTQKDKEFESVAEDIKEIKQILKKLTQEVSKLSRRKNSLTKPDF